MGAPPPHLLCALFHFSHCPLITTPFTFTEKELKKQKEAEKKAAKEAAKANGTANVSAGNAANNCKNWNAYNQFTVGINLLDRDERSVNEHVNLNFEDLIGEPDAAQGFDGAYRLSFGIFQFIRFWVYRILMTILSVPFALLWALVFALLSLVSVWVLTPAFRVLDIFFYFVHRVSYCPLISHF